MWTEIRQAHNQAMWASLAALRLSADSYELNHAVLVALETPVPFGPRKRDQFSASAKAAADKSVTSIPIPSAATHSVVIARRTFGMC